MEYWLEQWEELRGLLRGKRIDLQACADAEKVDDATGVDGLRGFRPGRPTNQQLAVFLAPPVDLATWARSAAATQLPAEPDHLELQAFEIFGMDLKNGVHLAEIN